MLSEHHLFDIPYCLKQLAKTLGLGINASARITPSLNTFLNGTSTNPQTLKAALGDTWKHTAPCRIQWGLSANQLHSSKCTSLFASVCLHSGTITWAPARLLSSGSNPSCRWLEMQPEISVWLMNYSLHLTPASHQAPSTTSPRRAVRQRRSWNALFKAFCGTRWLRAGNAVNSESRNTSDKAARDW